MVLAPSTASTSSPPPPLAVSAAPPRQRTRGARSGRWIYLGLGWGFFSLGVLGAALPLLPTTPFMILAAWAFSRSSPRFERWLLDHKWFGPSVRRFREHRVVPRKAKLMSWGMMSITFVYCVVSGRVPVWGLVAQAALMGYGAWFVARFPDKIPDGQSVQEC